jgi:hypothetical protein
MSIIRICHNKDNPYVQLNKNALWDERLSLRAVGLWARCMSRPNDWKFYVPELAKTGKEKEKAIYSTLRELIEIGYVMKLSSYKKGEGGRFEDGDVEYIFFEFIPSEEDKYKITEEFKKSHRNRLCGDRRGGDRRDALLLNKEGQEKKEDVCCADAPGIDSSLSEEEERAEEPERIVQEPKEPERDFSANKLSDTSIIPETFTKPKPGGGVHHCVQSEILVRLMHDLGNFPTGLFKPAMKALLDFKKPIGDPYLFVKQTIENMIVKQKSENIKKSYQRKSTWNKSNGAQEPKKSPKKEQKSSSEESSAKDMSMHPSHDWGSMLKLPAV